MNKKQAFSQLARFELGDAARLVRGGWLGAPDPPMPPVEDWNGGPYPPMPPAE